MFDAIAIISISKKLRTMQRRFFFRYSRINLKEYKLYEVQKATENVYQTVLGAFGRWLNDGSPPVMNWLPDDCKFESLRRFLSLTPSSREIAFKRLRDLPARLTMKHAQEYDRRRAEKISNSINRRTRHTEMLRFFFSLN